MITFLQERLQKHYKWLLAILLVVISVSFIFAYSSASGLGKKQPTFNFYSFNLYEPKTQKRIFEGAGLSLYLHTGQTLRNEKDLQDLGFARASLLYLADTLGIPEPDEAGLKAFIATLPLFKQEDGSFNAGLYQEFQHEIESQLGGSLAYQILQDDCRLQGIENLLTGPSYVQTIEVENYLNQFHGLWSISVAKLKPNTSNDPQPTVNTDDLEKFYKSNLSTYRTQPQVSIGYVCMEEVEPEKGEEKAHGLVYELYEKSISYNSEAFHKVLQEKQLSLLKLEPFPLDTPPENSLFPKDILEEIFNLDETTYYTAPLRVGERVYVLFLDEISPPKQLSFNAVKSQVAKDYQAQMDRLAFEAKITAVATQLETVLTAENFKDKAQALGLEYKELSPFKLSTPPTGLGLSIASQIRKLKEGEISSPILQDQEAIWVYVNKRLSPSCTQDSPEWRLAYQQIETLVTFSRLQSSLTDWVSRGLPTRK